MAELKTRPTKVSVTAFINAIADPARRADCKVLVKLMREVTGERPEMWGPSIVGFGRYLNTTTQGSAEWPIAGFSPRKQNLVLYIATNFKERAGLLKQLGEPSCGKSCVYLKRLSDTDPAVLKKLVAASVRHMRAAYPSGGGSK